MPSDAIITRRKHVNELVDRNYTNKQISVELGISISTVSIDKKAILKTPELYAYSDDKHQEAASSTEPATEKTNKTNTVENNNANNEDNKHSSEEPHDVNAADAHKSSSDANPIQNKNENEGHSEQIVVTNDDKHDAAIDMKATVRKVSDEIDNMVDDESLKIKKQLDEISNETRNRLSITDKETANLDSNTVESNPAYINNADKNTDDNAVNDADSDFIDKARATAVRLTDKAADYSDKASAGFTKLANNPTLAKIDDNMNAIIHDDNERRRFMRLSDSEKWTLKENEKSHAYIKGAITGAGLIAVLSIILNLIF